VLALLLLGAPAWSQSITGRVISSTGSGVAGVNIDAFRVSDGVEAQLSNDGTDASGNFNTTVDDGPGVYRFVFYPPPPPTTTHLVGERDNVVVAGTVNLGNVALGAGVSVSGRTVRNGSIPVADVTLSVIDGPSGGTVLLGQTQTTAFGTFNVAVPAHAIELRLDATTSAFELGSKAFDLTPAGNTALGDILLPPGFTVTGTVRTTGGSAVTGADLDFELSSTGAEAYTPGDNTNAAGTFSVVVASGTYDIEICPKPADPLATGLISGQAINSDVNLGIITLQNGVTLSGTITEFGGGPATNADVDVLVSSTGQQVPLCRDNTDATGHYLVRVPTGTYDVRFICIECQSPLAWDEHLDVVVAGNTVLNGSLPELPAATSAVWAGDGINADSVAPVDIVLGAAWSAPLTIGHPHGGGGPVTLKVRSTTVNGPNLPSPVGGRPTEILVGGPILSTFGGNHNGSTGGIAPQTVPLDGALVGLNWAAQYTVVGGGFADLSKAVFGTIGCQ